MTIAPMRSGEVAAEALSIPHAFAEQVSCHGPRPAVIDDGTVITYAELAARCQELAARLTTSGDVAAELDVVAILCAHGSELVIAVLACLSAGKTVIILDPADPPARWRELMEVGCAQRVVADSAHRQAAAGLARKDLPPVEVTAVMSAASRDAATVSLPASTAAAAVEGGAPSKVPGGVEHADLNAETIAFILFTSGTTGRPKGVLATHGNIVRNVRNYARAADLCPDDRMSLLSRLQYMAGISGLFGALLTGAAVAPFDIRQRGFRDMREWLVSHRISILHLVPTLFRRFCESLDPGARFDGVRMIKLGGEPVTHHDLKLWRRHFSPASCLINGLGLSEANGNLCHYKVAFDDQVHHDVIPVGRPLPGVEIKLISETGAEVRAGQVGEIAFRCPHRAPGYWRSDDFAKRLVGVGVADVGERYFRTGDLGRFLPDGSLQHLGRGDDMMKIRGVRVEPAQIEAVMLEDDRIRQCAVGVHGAGSRPRQLVAWIVPAPGALPTPDSLRAVLARRLSPALIPSAFVTLKTLPTTHGGKVDRHALPAPRPHESTSVTAALDAPRDALELGIARLWQKILRVAHVHRTDDFFALGGDSLAAAAMVSKAEGQFRATVDLAAFFTSPTPRDLAQLIRSTTNDPVHRRLVLTHEGGRRTPYFFVPGAGAVGHDLASVTHAGERPRYWFQHKGVDGVSLPERSVEAMAQSFLEEIRKVQPRGPYLLGGGSFGALVAMEAAHQLIDAGEEVRLLVVEDSLLDGCLAPKRAGRWTDRLERSLLWLLPVGKRFELTWSGVHDGMRQWGYRWMLPLARWRARRRGKPMAKVHRFHDVLVHSLTAKRAYRMRPYGGEVVLIRTQFRAADRLFELEPSLGWQSFCPRLRTIVLEGEKGDRVHDPIRRAAYLARLATVLDEADPS